MAEIQQSAPSINTQQPQTWYMPAVLSLGQLFAGMATNAFTLGLADKSEIGRATANLLSSGVTASANNMINNFIKGDNLFRGLGTDAASSLAGAGVGIASNYFGKGVTSLMGNSNLGKATGAALSTVASNYGGLFALKLLGRAAGSVNPYSLAMLAAGSALGAVTGPSKEYQGTYGDITRISDAAYDAITAAANFIPGAGLFVSGGLALNKGLSNIFGSTDGMTVQDAILGSAFMPAPVKWLNMLGSSKTGTFNNQSWQNSLQINSFMQNGYGNINDVFDEARKKAGKTYGTFSQGAAYKALSTINKANDFWNKLINLSNQDLYLRIRSQDMTSINNLRYSTDILGGIAPISRGKMGMKIFNNLINHNLGLRYLSLAALICKEED